MVSIVMKLAETKLESSHGYFIEYEKKATLSSGFVFLKMVFLISQKILFRLQNK